MNLTLNTATADYTFTLYSPDIKFYRIAGIYTFVICPEKKDIQHPASIIQSYSLLYAGITNDFYARLRTHHKIQQAAALGMTHIGILRKSSGRKRKTIERDLLKTYNPPLNQTWLQEYINTTKSKI